MKQGIYISPTGQVAEVRQSITGCFLDIGFEFRWLRKTEVKILLESWHYVGEL